MISCLYKGRLQNKNGRNQGKYGHEMKDEPVGKM